MDLTLFQKDLADLLQKHGATLTRPLEVTQRSAPRADYRVNFDRKKDIDIDYSYVYILDININILNNGPWGSIYGCDRGLQK